MAGVAVSEEKQARPWLRMKNESAKTYSHFQVYLRLGPNNRSFGKTSEEVRCSVRNIERIASRWNWVERADAWDRHNEELNLARFEKLRARAAQRRLERELQRREEAEQVKNLLLERAQRMLTWPLEEEMVTEKTEITADGQRLHITNRVVKPVKWDMNTAVRVVEALDRMQHASVEDALKAQETAGIPAEQIAERHFTLHSAEQVQQPTDTSMDDAPREGNWTVDEGGDGVHRPTEPRILW
ncbi:MAG TPA: hypothetical protein VLE22_23355 [Bryobacteraceae bacterium]|nr:hypothetical protein [Bryobacteraceae bacterium]